MILKSSSKAKFTGYKKVLQNQIISHPHIIIQDDLLNHSRIKTVVVCALSSNLNKVNMPGNLLLDVGEGNLPKQSVVEVAKVSTVYKAQLGEYIGSLDEKRVKQILSGMNSYNLHFSNADLLSSQ